MECIGKNDQDDPVDISQRRDPSRCPTIRFAMNITPKCFFSR